ncbi:hypothetical protein LWI29_022490 [Acer saccharum]|uniref:Reverse transcriptase Ty1/copia-type domain-containing protein n=1 Tax=Acer saccharum TaxID=4024 RepID=A0AA39RR69_ACESA|nr:hypothetical protein LWI29_022490 [Acer saccharum]
MPCKILDQPIESKTDPLKDDANTIQVEVSSPLHSPDTVEENPIEDDGAAHSDDIHQVEESHKQPEVLNPLADYELVRDRAKRISKPNSKFSYADVVSFALCTGQEIENYEPRTFSEAVNCIDKLKWQQAMLEEMNSIEKNQTWTLVRKPEKQKVVACKWLYKINDSLEQNVSPRYKARLVAKGFTQREGIDYNEIFSPVVKYKTIRIILALVSYFDMELEKLDVKTAFLHGDLDETIYMSQPKGFESKSKPSHVCLLKKSLYGLKQAPRQWNKKFDSFMTSIGFHKSNFDACLYFSSENIDNSVYLLLYVDDMLIASKEMSRIIDLKEKLKSEFEMKDLGNAKMILGMEIVRIRKENSLCRKQFVFKTDQLFE